MEVNVKSPQDGVCVFMCVCMRGSEWESESTVVPHWQLYACSMNGSLYTERVGEMDWL